MKSLLLALGLLFIGCGSSSDLTNNQGFSGPINPTSNSSEFLGRVIDEAGAPVSGVDVVVHERTSNLKFKTSTASDGTFRLLAPRGTYDLGLNKTSDPTTATCFYGPVTSPGSGVQDFTLVGVSGRSADTLFGQLLSEQGQADAGRRLIVQPALAHSGGDQPLPNPVEVFTGSQGRFEIHLLSTRPLSLDLDLYESSGLSEWVDVAKLEKACYVKLSTGASIPKNRLRAAQSDGPTRSTPIAPRLQATVLPLLLNKFVVETKDTPNEIIFVHQATFRDGLLTVQDFDGSTTDGYSSLTDLSSTGTLPGSLDGISSDLVVPAGNGSWWYDFAVNVYDQDRFKNLLWKFNDVSGDFYLLTMHALDDKFPPVPRWHKVSYNSGRPDITRIVIQISEER